MSKRRLAMHKRPIGNAKAFNQFACLPKWKIYEVAIDLALGGTGFDETEPVDNVLEEIAYRAKLLTKQKAYRLRWSD